MKDKITITLDADLLSSIDGLVESDVGKNRSQIIELFLQKYMMEKTRIHAIIIAHDIKWDDGEYSFSGPKYLLEIDGKSVIFHQLRTMSQAGIHKVTLIVADGLIHLYKSALDKAFPHMEILYSEVDPLSKTGSALKSAISTVTDAEYLLITNGDTYIPDLDIRDLLEYHKSNHADWTFVLKYIRSNIERFGNVTIHGNKVEEFIEKPSSKDFYRYLTNCGWYLVNRDFYDGLAYEGEHLENDLFPNLPKLGNIYSYTYSKPWYHIQSLAEYETANGWVL